MPVEKQQNNENTALFSNQFFEDPDEFESFVNSIVDRITNIKKAQRKHDLKVIIIGAALFLGVLTASTVLTYAGKLSSSAYTFLLGTIVGYLLTFIDKNLGGAE